MHCCTSSPKAVGSTLLRVTFGLSLMFVGLTHCLDLNLNPGTMFSEYGAFTIMAKDGLGPLEFLGVIWSYVMPLMMIVGGALFVIGRYSIVATWVAGIALASIPAGTLIKPLLSGIGQDEMMPLAINGFIWLLVYMVVVKSSGCGNACASDCGCIDGGSTGSKFTPAPKSNARPGPMIAKTPAAPAPAKGMSAAPKAAPAKTAATAPAKTMTPAPAKGMVAAKKPAPAAPKTTTVKITPAPKKPAPPASPEGGAVA